MATASIRRADPADKEILRQLLEFNGYEFSRFFDDALVLPKYRRGGIGTTAAREVFAMFPGRWDVHQIAGNDGATAFWRNAIPVEFTETRGSGHRQHFTIS